MPTLMPLPKLPVACTLSTPVMTLGGKRSADCEISLVFGMCRSRILPPHVSARVLESGTVRVLGALDDGHGGAAP